MMTLERDYTYIYILRQSIIYRRNRETKDGMMITFIDTVNGTYLLMDKRSTFIRLYISAKGDERNGGERSREEERREPTLSSLRCTTRVRSVWLNNSGVLCPTRGDRVTQRPHPFPLCLRSTASTPNQWLALRVARYLRPRKKVYFRRIFNQ